MSGEFLRGVLEKNSLFAEYAVYTLEAVVPFPVPSSPIPVFLSTKADRYFLAVGMQLKIISTLDVVTDLSYNLARLVNPRNSFYYIEPAPGMVPKFFGGNVNGMYMLPEYPLFYPSSMISYEITNNTLDGTALAAESTISLALFGIEYAQADNKAA